MDVSNMPPEGRDESKKSMFSTLTTGQKITIGLVAGGVLIALLMLIVGSSGTEWAVLYSDLSPEDAGRIVEQLKESGVKYKLTSGGSTIMTPANKIYELRMEMASKGYPQGAGAGFELFDKNGFGATEFTQKVNYTRALQGELARTIMALNPVEQARVHVVMPEERLFSEQQKPTTASIVLKMKPGAYLADAQVRGVVHLVASSVQGLTPENVTVLDTDGNMLWRGTGSTAAAGAGTGIAGIGPMSASQLEAKMAFEQEMQRRIETMLDRVLGIGKAVVRVYADINFDSSQRESETYQPLADGRGVPISEQVSSERRSGGEDTPGGLAGSPSNIDGYPLVGQTSDAGASSYSKTDRTVNYEVSKVVERAVIAPGRVERISVACMVDGPLTQDRMAAIREVVSTAAGIQPDRGDQVTVSGIEFAKPVGAGDMSEAMDDVAKLDKRNFVMRMVRTATPVILGIIVLIFALTFLRMFRPVPEPQDEEVEEITSQTVGRTVDEVLAEETPQLELSPEEIAARAEEKRKLEMKQAVEDMAHSKPAEVARILETWMSED